MLRLPPPPAYDPSLIVDAFLLCPVADPPAWDPAAFDSSLKNFVPRLWAAADDAPEAYLASAGKGCGRHLLDGLAFTCTRDDWGRAGRAGAGSLAAPGGCCLAECAAEMAAKNARCLDLVFQLACRDPSLRPFAAGL